jgi:hypothetical protein
MPFFVRRGSAEGTRGVRLGATFVDNMSDVDDAETSELQRLSRAL